MIFDFLMCSERSGSNLITKLLDSHPEICGPFPSHLMRCFVPQLYRYGSLDKVENWNILLKDVAFYTDHMQSTWSTHLSPDNLKARVVSHRFGELYRYIYEYEASHAGKSRVFVKENHSYNFLPFIKGTFPEAKIIWLVRDPRDMALTWKEASSAPGGVRQGADVWKMDQSKMLQQYGFLKNLGKVLAVTFEQLLSDTEAVLSEVCRFLGIDYSENMLMYHQKDNVQLNAAKLTSWNDLSKPLIKDNFNLYKTRLSEVEIRFVEQLCMDEMEFFGYEPQYDNSRSLEDLTKELPENEGTFSEGDMKGNPAFAARNTSKREQEVYQRVSLAVDQINSRKLYKGV